MFACGLGYGRLAEAYAGKLRLAFASRSLFYGGQRPRVFACGLFYGRVAGGYAGKLRLAFASRSRFYGGVRGGEAEGCATAYYWNVPVNEARSASASRHSLARSASASKRSLAQSGRSLGKNYF